MHVDTSHTTDNASTGGRILTNWQIYKLIRRNDELKDKRHPMFERNRFVKFLAYFMVAYYAAILLFMGVILPFGLGDLHTGIAAFQVFDGWFFVILVLDFWLRFALQDTPANQMKSYALLPIRRNFLMNIYLTRAGLSLGNLFWGFMLVPFAIEAVLPLMGWSGAIMWLLAYWLMIVANSYAYLLTRAACTRHMLWFLVPLALHAGVICLAVIPDHNILRLPSTLFIYNLTQGKMLYFAPIVALIGFFYWSNMKLQGSITFDDVAKKEDVEVKNATQMTFLDRFGALGEYMKMEIKLRMRNKQVRIQFFVALGLMVLLSGLMYFTPAYDGEFMTSFICLYDYIILGMMTLITIMGYEGNYIDGLMSRRESILALLTAKYYFNSILLLVPIIITTPLMIIGKITLWMNFGYLFFTVGVIYPIVFQLAIYNKDTLPLNNKLTGKQANMAQNIMSFTILFVPIGLEKLCVTLCGDIWGHVILIILGLIGILTHKIWLRNIYQRMMARRYINLEGFRATKN